MKRFNSKVYLPAIFSLTILFGGLSLFYSRWFFLGLVVSMISFIYMQNRAEFIEHYCIGVDLNTNREGDVIEIYIYAFNKAKNQYNALSTYFKQLRIYVNVRLLDKFYSNIGYPIFEDLNYSIRKVANTEFSNINDAKKYFKKMVSEFNQSYKFGGATLRDLNMEQPGNKRLGFGTKLWNWWTFKTN